MALVERPCLVCGSPMTTTRANKAICSASCHGKAARLRVKQGWSLAELVTHYNQLQQKEESNVTTTE